MGLVLENGWHGSHFVLYWVSRTGSNKGSLSTAMRTVLRHEPCAEMWHQPMQDTHAHDLYALLLCVFTAGLMRRELLVLDTCLAAGIPVAGYVGGGYAADLDVLAERHMLLHKAAVQMWEGYELHLGKSAWLTSVCS
jgi:hypothetical protein